MEADKTEFITLTLSRNEARWLKDCMQNPFVDDESAEDTSNRKRLFTVLTTVLYEPGDSRREL